MNKSSNKLNIFWKLIATVCGLGLIPFVPAIWGALGGFLIFYSIIVGVVFLAEFLKLNVIFLVLMPVILIFMFFILGKMAIDKYILFVEAEKYKQIVIDKAFGLSISFCISLPFIFGSVHGGPPIWLLILLSIFLY